jgi:hypothetical protein
MVRIDFEQQYRRLSAKSTSHSARTRREKRWKRSSRVDAGRWWL